MELEHKAYPIDLKAVDVEESTFEGFSAGIGNRDSQDDIIEPGAFKKTIRERVSVGAVKLLNGHNPSDTENVWGFVLEAEERPAGERPAMATREKGQEKPTHLAWSKFKMSKAAPAAQIALRKIEETVLNALSIGFKPTKVEFRQEDGSAFEDEEGTDPMWEWYMGRAVRHIKELAWWETSLVTWGANAGALVIPGTVKSLLTQLETARGGELPKADVLKAITVLNTMLQDGEKASEVLRCMATAEEVDRAATHLSKVTASGVIPKSDKDCICEKMAALQDILEAAKPGTIISMAGGVPTMIEPPADGEEILLGDGHLALVTRSGTPQISEPDPAAAAPEHTGDGEPVPAEPTTPHSPSEDELSMELDLLELTSMQMRE